MKTRTALVLLIGAALAMQSARTVWQHPGFEAEPVAYVNLKPAHAGYQGAQATRYAADLRRRLKSLPSVESIAYSWVGASGLRQVGSCWH